MTSLVNEIERVFNKDYKVTMNTMVKVFDYILFLIYKISFYLRWGNISLQVISPKSEKYIDRKVIDFGNRFCAGDQKYETVDEPNGYIRYMLRNDHQKYNEWSRFYLDPRVLWLSLFFI